MVVRLKQCVCFGAAILLSLLAMNLACASTVHGTVYNMFLNKQTNAIVSVNSTTKQTIVAKEAAYSFTLPTGSYVIEARYLENGELQGSAAEEIVIAKEGNYVVDLILFPSFEDEGGMLSESVDISDIYKERLNFLYYIVAGGAVFIMGFVVYMILKYKYLIKKISRVEVEEVGAESANVIDFIRKQGSRATQKDIRKHFPSSEAKVSLILTELEHKGIVEKIKKGRGNVIILKK